MQGKNHWRRTLDLIRADGGVVTTPLLAELLGSNQNTVRQHMNNLLRRGLVAREMHDHTPVWIVEDAEPTKPVGERLKVTEIKPGHRRVSFGAGWRPESAQTVRHAYNQGISGAGLCTLQAE